MTHVVDVFAENPLLTVFTVVALGTLFGSVRFGPVRLGSAGALFVGLAVGALDPRLGAGLELLQTLGLALFVYTVGLAVGYVFFTTLKRQAPALLVCAAATLVAVGAGAGLGRLLRVSAPMVAGAFAGTTTTTPGLAAATQAAGGSDDPAVGNALGYPVGVLVTILVLVFVTRIPLPARRDPEPVTAGGLSTRSVSVTHDMALTDIPGWRDQLIQMSYLRRGDSGRVLRDDDSLLAGDRVLVIGSEATLAPAVAALGTMLPYSLTENRTDVDHRTFTISNPEIAGRTLAEIDLGTRLGGRVTRVLRGDTQILARDSLVLALGDRVLAVVPAGTLDEAAEIFGDSTRSISEVDALSLGVGMGLGLALGALTIPLGQGFFALGAAAGPLVVGMILGRLRRTGPLVWEMPHSANLTIRQLGLLLFLTCVGLSSGQAFIHTAFTRTGVTAGFVGIVIAVVITLLTWAGAAFVGLSTARTAGLVAGIIGQPALLAFAQLRTDDERVETGYSTVFAIGLVVKTILAYLLATAW